MTHLMRSVWLLCVAAALSLTGCIGTTRGHGVLAQPEPLALARERDSLWIRTLALAAESDALRANTTRLEVELQARDEQLRAVRFELQRLKEIDLRSQRKPPL
jgi:hypothetical protein